MVRVRPVNGGRLPGVPLLALSRAPAHWELEGKGGT